MPIHPGIRSAGGGKAGIDSNRGLIPSGGSPRLRSSFIVCVVQW
ncbi:hypothetical protein RISK_005745 [Rhodopirellula islandica]|uniref:Uncharacterized protein n=1 Tax=Rhodopirellula islandica TaxID=595434 RepID=A0A0J1EAP4_RHOIS|nr:hypothetical protein RISK_005745 [Rhodopirellula islandica]